MAEDDVIPFGANSTFSSYSHMGRNYGNPLLNLMGVMASGHNYMPQPQNGQSMHDAFLQRERSAHFMELKNSSFANSPLMSALGATRQQGQLAGALAGSPDSAIAKMVSPVLGGNPMAASMHMYASMAGRDATGAFGRTSNISSEETEGAMQKMAQKFYTTQQYEGPGGGREEIRSGTQKFLKGKLNEGRTGAKYLADLTGEKLAERDFVQKDVEGGAKKGDLTTEARSRLESKISKFDVTDSTDSKKQDSIKDKQATQMQKNYDNVLQQSDQETQKALNERFEKQLKAFRIATKDQIEQSRGAGGVISQTKLNHILTEYRKNGQVDPSVESQDASTQLADDLQQSVDKLSGKAAAKEQLNTEFKQTQQAISDAEKKTATQQFEKTLRSQGLGDLLDDKDNSIRIKKGQIDPRRVEDISELLKSGSETAARELNGERTLRPEDKQRFEGAVKRAGKDMNEFLSDKGDGSYDAEKIHKFREEKNAALQDSFVKLGGAASWNEKRKARGELNEKYKDLYGSEADIRHLDAFEDTYDKKKLDKAVAERAGSRTEAITEKAQKLLSASPEEKKEANKSFEQEMKKYGATANDIGGVKTRGEVDMAKVERYLGNRDKADNPNLQKNSDALEEKLKTLGMSGQQIDKYKNNAGTIDYEKVKNLPGMVKEGQLPNEGEEEGGQSSRRQLASRSYERKKQAVNINESLDDLAASREGDDEKDVQKNKNESAIKKLIHAHSTDFLGKEVSSPEKVAMGEANKVLKERGMLDKKGNLDIEKAKTYVAHQAQDDYLDKKGQESQAAEKAGFKYNGVNFANTRGFKLEELEKGFSTASKLRMLGDQRGKDYGDELGKFTEKAGGSLSAARAVFGNRSTDELVKQMSNVAGAGAVDLTKEDENLGNPGDTIKVSKMESRLRRMNATARVAGVSNETITGLMESGKDLAKSNPQLQRMNSGSIAELSLNAIGKASTMSANMSDADYRAAGGAQGLAAEHVKESLNFAQTGMGGFQSAILAASKGTEGYEGIKKRFAQGMTAHEFSTGGASEIGKLMGGKTAMEVLNIGNNKMLQQEGFEDEDIASSTTGEAAENSVVKSFFAHNRRVKGLSDEALTKKYKESEAKGESYADFEKREIMTKLRTPRQQQEYRQSRRMIQNHLLMSGKTEAEKNEFKTTVQEQAKDEAVTAKEFDSANSPLITQMTSAIASGKGVEGAAENLAKVFSTDDKMSTESKKAMQDAREAGGKIAELSGTEHGDKKLMEKGMGKEMNKIIADRRTSAEETLKSDSASEGDKAAATKTLATLSKKGLTDEQYEKARKAAKIKGGTALEARQRLETLRDTKDLKADEKEEMEGLELNESTGAMADEKSWALAKEGTVRSQAASTVQAQATSNIEAKRSALEEKRMVGLDKRLQTHAKQSGGETIKEALDFYKDKGGVKQMMKDRADPSKNKENNYFSRFEGMDSKAKSEKFSRLDKEMSRTKDYINSDKEKAAAKGQSVSSGGSTGLLTSGGGGDISKLFEGLIQALNTGALTRALSDLATALN